MNKEREDSKVNKNIQYELFDDEKEIKELTIKHEEETKKRAEEDKKRAEEDKNRRKNNRNISKLIEYFDIERNLASKLVENNLETVHKISKLKIEDFAGIDGLEEKEITNLKERIKEVNKINAEKKRLKRLNERRLQRELQEEWEERYKIQDRVNEVAKLSPSLEDGYEILAKEFLANEETSSDEDMLTAMLKIYGKEEASHLKLESGADVVDLGEMRKLINDKKIYPDLKKSIKDNVVNMLESSISDERINRDAEYYAFYFLDWSIKPKQKKFLKKYINLYLEKYPIMFDLYRRFLYSGAYDSNAKLLKKVDENKRILELTWTISNDFPFAWEREEVIIVLFYCGIIFKDLGEPAFSNKSCPINREDYQHFLNYFTHLRDNKNSNQIKAVENILNAWIENKLGKKEIKWNKKQISLVWNYPNYFSLTDDLKDFKTTDLEYMLSSINNYLNYDLTPDKEILNEYIRPGEDLDLNWNLVRKQLGIPPIKPESTSHEPSEISSVQDYLKNLKTKQKKET